ncbi:MAG: glycerophosphodiester phosphodiesterase [Myxococcaceae bacterium]|nr:glycerophosphodiester phosphodiesterase [Myxococcaceae bacterium]
MHPFLQRLKAPLHISHRGGAALAPENTLAAFRQAVETFHTDMLELDVRLTRDGVVVVAHDPTVDRCTDGRGPVNSYSFGELIELDAGHRFTRDGATFPFRGQGVRIPTLAEVLTTFPEVRVNLEVKEAAAVEATIETLEKTAAIDRVCLGSEHDAIGERLHALAPGACHFFPKDALANLILPLRLGDEPVVDPRYSVLDMPLEWEGERLFDARLRDAAAARGLWINVWTIDDPAEMRRCIGEGVGGVMTDRPDLLQAVLEG